MRKQNGFTFVEMVIGVALTMILTGMILKGYQVWREKSAERATGAAMVEFNNALGTYMSTYFQGLIQSPPGLPYLKAGSTPSSASTANPASYANIPTGRTACYKPEDPQTPTGCTPVLYQCSDPAYTAFAASLPCLSNGLQTNPMSPTAADLKLLRLLPSGAPESLPEMQAQFISSIRQTGTTTAPNLESLVISSVPWLKVPGDAANSTPATNTIGSAMVKRAAAAARLDPKLGYTSPATPLTALFPVTAGGALNGVSLADFNLAPYAFPSGGLLVAHNGYSSEQWAQYQRLDDTQARTGDLNFGGHMVKNLKQVTLGSACDGVSPSSSASKALVGAMATFDSPFKDGNGEKLGSGVSLSCGYDRVVQGYVWRTSPTGTIEDVQSGLYEGRESLPRLTCWGISSSDTGAWTVGTSGMAFIKFIIKNGDAWGYAAQIDGAGSIIGWVNVTRTPPGSIHGYDVSHNYSAFNKAMGVFPILIFDPVSGEYQCKKPVVRDPVTQAIIAGDPNIIADTAWELGPQQVIFNASFTYYLQGQKGGKGATADDLSGIPVVYQQPIYGVNCGSDPVSGAVTGCSIVQTGTQPVNLTTVQRNNADSTTGTWMAMTVANSSTIWSINRKSNCNLGPIGQAAPAFCNP